MGFNPFKQIKGAFNKGRRAVNPADRVKDGINKVKDTIKKEVIDEVKKDLISPVENKIKAVEKVVETKVIRKVKVEIIKPVENRLAKIENTAEQITELAFKAIAQRAAQLAAGQFIQVLERVRPVGKEVWCFVGWFKLIWEFNDERLSHIKQLAHHPPSFKSGVITTFESFGPNYLDFEPSVSNSGH